MTVRPTSIFALSAVLMLGAAQAQTPDLQEQANLFRFTKAPVDKVVLASANMRVGVQLERLTLISGEGNMDKKITAGVLAGAFTLMGMRSGGANIARGVDFADREPIHEHLNKDDAEKINNEALAILLDKLKAAGVAVESSQAVASAPFYAAVKGEAAVTNDHLAQDGGLFKKSYFYGFYRTPVAGLKYRELGAMTLGFGDEELFPKAREAAGTDAALDVNVSFFNDKKVFGLFELVVRLWGPVQGRGSDVPIFAQTLKNLDDYTVPSGGKDAYAYWTAFKPKFETAAVAIADRMAKGLAESRAPR
jgi:hypothetical protein